MEDIGNVESEVDFDVAIVLVNGERLEEVDEFVDENTEGIVEEEENESVGESDASSDDDNKVINNNTINNMVMINAVLDRQEV